MAHACNHIYSGGWSWSIVHSRPASATQWDYLKIKDKKCWGISPVVKSWSKMCKVVGSILSPQKKTKQNKNFITTTVFWDHELGWWGLAEMTTGLVRILKNLCRGSQRLQTQSNDKEMETVLGMVAHGYNHSVEVCSSTPPTLSLNKQ